MLYHLAYIKDSKKAVLKRIKIHLHDVKELYTKPCMIEVNLSEPHTSESPTQVLCRQSFVNNTEKPETHHRLPCHGKVNGIDYRISLCRQLCHSEIHDRLQDFLICFVSLTMPREINGVDYTTLCKIHTIEEKKDYVGRRKELCRFL